MNVSDMFTNQNVSHFHCVQNMRLCMSYLPLGKVMTNLFESIDI